MKRLWNVVIASAAKQSSCQLKASILNPGLPRFARNDDKKTWIPHLSSRPIWQMVDSFVDRCGMTTRMKTLKDLWGKLSSG